MSSSPKSSSDVVRVVDAANAPTFEFGHSAGITVAKVVLSPSNFKNDTNTPLSSSSSSSVHVATCGNDGYVVVRDLSTKETIAQLSSSSSKEKKSTEEEEEEEQKPINAVATFQDKYIAIASDDHSVKLFTKEEGGEEGEKKKWQFKKNITRFALPAKCVAFSSDGKWIACGGEDTMIKVIDVETSEIKFSLKIPSKGIKSLQFNGENKSILVASDVDGVMTVWTLQPDNSDKTDKNDYDEPGDVKLRATVCPVTDIDAAESMNTVSVRFDGKVVAVPGRENNVEFFNLETFKEIDERKNLQCSDLEHGNKENFSVVSFSPNGKFCFAASKDKKCIVWNVKKNKPIVVLNVSDTNVCSMDWIEGENAVVMTNADGEWAKWENVLSSSELIAEGGSKTNPFFQATSADELRFFSNEEDSKFATKDAMLDGELDDDDDMEDDDGFVEEDEEDEKENRKRELGRPSATAHVSAPVIVAKGPKPQGSFQVNSTKVNPDTVGVQKRRFLCYNTLGSVVATEDTNSGLKNVEMSFHDTSRGGRMPTITDDVGYDLGVCGETGVLLAAKSQIFFKPYESWTKDSEWTLEMPEDERPTSIACGDDFVAVASSQNMLRIFTSYGAQKEVLNFEGPIVTLAAANDSLAVCYREHFSECKLKFKVYDVEKRIEKYAGNVPLSCPDSEEADKSQENIVRLTWMGFVENSSESALAICDSTGICRIYSKQAFSGSWVPCFDSKKARDSDLEKHWIVSLSNKECKTVVCKSAEYGPSVNPKPVLSILPLSVPALQLEGSSFDIEEKGLTAKLALNVCNAAASEKLSNANAKRARDRELAEAKATFDKAMMKCLVEAVKADRLARAGDIAVTFERPAMVDAAAKFAKAMKKSNLAERILMLAEDEDDEEDSSDDEDDEDSSDEEDEKDDGEKAKDDFEAAAKTPAPKPSSVAKQQKVQKENVAVGSSGKKRDSSKSTPSTLKKKARTSAGGDKNPFARK